MPQANYSTSSYNLLLSNNGSGLYTPTILRNPTTVASGGTSITLPWVENTGNGTNATSLLPGVAFMAAVRAALDDIANNGTSNSYNLYLSNNGSGVYTPSVIKNAGTAASGGTAVTIPWVENTGNGANTTSFMPYTAAQAGLRAILDDIANGN